MPIRRSSSSFLATGPNVTSVVDTGLTEGTTYAWRVKAFNAVGNSDYSNTV